jgi:hypothetical protein
LRSSPPTSPPSLPPSLRRVLVPASAPAPSLLSVLSSSLLSLCKRDAMVVFFLGFAA